MSDVPGWGLETGAGALEKQSPGGTGGDALVPVVGLDESRLVGSTVDRLRVAIVNDDSRHGVWLRLAGYGPLPKRIASKIASSWRRASPDLFGGDHHFSARIVPTVRPGSGGQTMTVRAETLYAVDVFYPRTETLDTPPGEVPE